MIVVDTNVALQLVIESDHSAMARELASLEPDWRMPSFWRIEFLNALATQLRSGILSRSDIEVIRAKAEALHHIHEANPVESRALDFVELSRVSAYDALFLALADHLGTKLVTLDQKLAKAAPKLAVSLVDFIQKH